MPTIDARAAGGTLLVHPGNAVTLELTWPSTLAGRTFTSDLAGTTITPSVVGSVISVTFSALVTTALTRSKKWTLTETTGGPSTALMVLKLIPGIADAEPGPVEFTINVGAVAVDVQLIGGSSGDPALGGALTGTASDAAIVDGAVDLAALAPEVTAAALGGEVAGAAATAQAAAATDATTKANAAQAAAATDATTKVATETSRASGVEAGLVVKTQNAGDFASLPKARRNLRARARQDDWLLQWRQAVGACDTALAVGVVACDSIFATVPGSIYGPVGIPQRLMEDSARDFNKYGRPGRGTLPIYSDDGSGGYPYGWNNTAGTITGNTIPGTTPTGASTFGPGGWGRILTTGDAITHPESRGLDGLDIWYTAQSLANGATIGLAVFDSAGGSLGTFSVNTGDAALSGTAKRYGNRFSTGQLAGIAASVTMTISGGGGRTAYVESTQFHLGNVTAGVDWHSWAHAGWLTNQLNPANGSTLIAQITTLQPHLLITDTAQNDRVFGVSVATHTAFLVALWAAAKAACPNISILHVSSYQAQGWPDWDVWRDSDEAAAAANGVAFLDLLEPMGDLSHPGQGAGGGAAADPFGLSPDGTHPNDKGHGIIAGLIGATIAPVGGRRSTKATVGGLLRTYADSNGYPFLELRLHESDALQAASIGYNAITGPALALSASTLGASPTATALLGVNADASAFNLFGLWKITGSTVANAATDLMSRAATDARHGVPDATTLQVSASVLSVKNNGIGLAQLLQVASGSFLGRVSASTGNVEVLSGAQAGGLITPNQLAAASGAWSLGQAFTSTLLTQRTATAANGSIQGETTGTDASNRDVVLNLRADSSFTNATVALAFVSSSGTIFFNGLFLGDGTDSAADVSYVRSAANAAKINATAGLTVTGNLTLSAKNIITDTTTGMKILTAATQKLGFYNVTPIVQYATTGTSTGFTAGAGTTATSLSTFTGNTGATAYTTGDVVRALKLLGLIAA